MKLTYDKESITTVPASASKSGKRKCTDGE